LLGEHLPIDPSRDVQVPRLAVASVGEVGEDLPREDAVQPRPLLAGDAVAVDGAGAERARIARTALRLLVHLQLAERALEEPREPTRALRLGVVGARAEHHRERLVLRDL